MQLADALFLLGLFFMLFGSMGMFAQCMQCIFLSEESEEEDLSVHDDLKRERQGGYREGFADGKKLAYSSAILFAVEMLAEYREINSLEARGSEQATERILGFLKGKQKGLER